MSTEPLYLGKYELRERLAQGGQGEVWKAFDTRLRRYVAIKRLHANLQADPDFASHFEREAQFVASLHHPNIVQIHDFQLLSNAAGQTSSAYMVMDYIEGPTLSDFLRNTSRQGQMPTAADIVYIFSAISLAIDYAHHKVMIHRDIKPANILLDQRAPRKNAIGTPILTDFGIAKLLGVSTDTISALGTPLYVSPEQAQSLPCNEQSDLYSLGIILYEMTTGVTPFRGDSYMAILMKHMQEEPISPARLNPGISPALSQVILKSIAKAPHERFRSASAMTIAIAEALSMPVPAELLQPKAMLPAENSTGILLSPPSAASMPVTDSSLPTYIPPPQMLLTPDPVATARTAPRQDTPITLVPPAEKLPARKRSIPLLLLALLIAAIAASGLFFALHRTTPPAAPSQVVAGQIRFLSSPTAPSGTIDEVEVTLNALPDAPAGEQYYAWLQINNENLFPIHWLITTTNGHLSSPTYRNSSLLANKPYLFLITLEKAHSNPQIANLASQARLYYALLPSSIQNQAAFAIHACPQGNNNTVCMS